MALSGNFTGSTDNQYIQPKIVWSASQSTTGNYSDVTATLYYSRTNTGYTTSGTWSGSITINGTKVSGSKSISITYNSNTKAMSAKVRVPHNSDGSKSVTIKASGGISGTSLESTTISKTVTLNTIPRSSSISSVANMSGGSAITLSSSENCVVSWTPASSSYYYKLVFSLGTWEKIVKCGKAGTTSEYSHAVIIPLDGVAQKITSDTSGTMKVQLYTYSDSYSTQVGSVTSKTFTVKIPSSVIPTIGASSITIDNSKNSVVSGWGECVVGYTKIKVSATASGEYGSTISGFTISGGYSTTVAGTSLNYTGGTFSSSGTKTFYVVAADSRGRSSAKVNLGSRTFYSYSKPEISKFKAYRDSNNQSSMKVEANWTYSEVNGHNLATAYLSYKKTTDTTWTTYSGTISKNAVTTLTGSFDTESSYDFKLVVKDGLNESEPSTSAASTMQVLMDFKAGGKGLGIGKIAEYNELEVGMASSFYKNLYIANDCEIRSYNEDRSSSRSILKGVSSEGNTLLGYGNYTNADANTNIYGNQIWFTANDGVHSKSRIVMPNNISIRGKAIDETELAMLYLSDSNNTVVGYGCYNQDKGNTNIYGVDVNIYSKYDAGSYIRPYFRTADTTTHIWTGAGFVKTSGTIVCFTVPLTKPVLGSPTVTVSSNSGFVLRQNGKYTHGSGYDSDAQAYIYKKPSSYSATITKWGIRIEAEFGTTTNAINHDVIGIYWSGNINFV